MGDEDGRAEWTAGGAESAIDRVERLPIGAHLRIEVYPPGRPTGNAGHDLDAAGCAFGEARAVDGRKGLLVTARRYEVQIAAATDGWHGFKSAGIHAPNLATVSEMQIGVHCRIVAIVEQEEAAVVRQKRFHGIVGIVDDGHMLRLLEGSVLGARGQLHKS